MITIKENWRWYLLLVVWSVIGLAVGDVIASRLFDDPKCFCFEEGE